VLHAHEDRRGHDLWHGVGLLITARALIDKLIATDPMPTGLFVAEDRLLPAIDAALSERGLKAGPGEQLELISCNNERPHLTGLHCQPATIDIRTQSIGRRGVEQLVWRLRHADGATAAERIRSMVEPLLIEPGADPAAAALEEMQTSTEHHRASRPLAAAALA
jgi:DNA-binding LacI/PurR family transcriptional regulator